MRSSRVLWYPHPVFYSNPLLIAELRARGTSLVTVVSTIPASVPVRASTPLPMVVCNDKVVCIARFPYRGVPHLHNLGTIHLRHPGVLAPVPSSLIPYPRRCYVSIPLVTDGRTLCCRYDW